MVLIQLDTGVSLGFLRGTQLLSGSPALTSELRGFLATSIGSQMAFLPSLCQIKTSHEKRISQSRIPYRFLSCFAEPQEAAEFLTYKRRR